MEVIRFVLIWHLMLQRLHFCSRDFQSSREENDRRQPVFILTRSHGASGEATLLSRRSVAETHDYYRCIQVARLLLNHFCESKNPEPGAVQTGRVTNFARDAVLVDRPPMRPKCRCNFTASKPACRCGKRLCPI